MLYELLASLRATALTIGVCAVAYPLAMLGIAAVVAPEARLGSLIVDDEGTIRGSRLIAQSFTQGKYFWPRPSACNYDASAAAGSNLSPRNPAIRERAMETVDRLGGSTAETLPADLVTASGAGLDPHISYQAAIWQAGRVATERGIDQNEVQQLIGRTARQIPLTTDAGSRIVCVLELNLALDALNDTTDE